MYELTITSSFAAAHNLRNYEGECERLHGHNWKVETTVASEGLNDIGMALDFKLLKRELNEILGVLDHSYLNKLEPFDHINPSSENISRYIFEHLSGKIALLNTADDPAFPYLKDVTVWESDTARASYHL